MGFYNKIVSSKELNITNQVLSRQLSDELFIEKTMAISITNLLIGLLKDKKYFDDVADDIFIYSKSDIKELFFILDRLMESLPNKYIDAFARSKYFDTYKKIFKKLGLTN